MLNFPRRPLLEVFLVFLEHSLVFHVRHVWPYLEIPEEQQYEIFNANPRRREVNPLDGLFVNMQVRVSNTGVVRVPVIRDDLMAPCIQERITIFLGFGFELPGLLWVANRPEDLRDGSSVIGVIAADQLRVRLIVNFEELFRLLERRQVVVT